MGEQVEQVGAALGAGGHQASDGMLLDEGEVGGADVAARELGGGDLDGAAGELPAGRVEQAAHQLAGGGVLELLEDGEHGEDDLDIGVGQPGTEGHQHVALRHRVGDQRAERLEAAQLVDAVGSRELLHEPFADDRPGAVGEQHELEPLELGGEPQPVSAGEVVVPVGGPVDEVGQHHVGGTVLVGCEGDVLRRLRRGLAVADELSVGRDEGALGQAEDGLVAAQCTERHRVLA